MCKIFWILLDTFIWRAKNFPDIIIPKLWWQRHWSMKGFSKLFYTVYYRTEKNPTLSISPLERQHLPLLLDITMVHVPPNSINCLTLANATYQFILLWLVSFKKPHKVNCVIIQWHLSKDQNIMRSQYRK